MSIALTPLRARMVQKCSANGCEASRAPMCRFRGCLMNMQIAPTPPPPDRLQSSEGARTEVTFPLPPAAVGWLLLHW